MKEAQGDFYFQGKWFDSSEEMFEYAREWRSFPLEQECAERIVDTLKKDIIMNVFLMGAKFNNNEFSNYVENIFQYSMKLLNDPPT